MNRSGDKRSTPMIGIIGGSGLYELEGIQDLEERRVDTVFGAPSDTFMCGRLGGVKVCFLPRHGRGHRLLPSEINHRANIMGMKLLGVDAVVSVSAVGSLRETIQPRDIVLPDQYFDRTKRWREQTFFGEGIVAHVAFGDPTCPELRHRLAEAARLVAAKEGLTMSPIKIHDSGTYVNMEGPAFSTKAESHVYRKLGFDVIGMTSLSEAKLCREAEICYQSMAMVTDYDCWHEAEEQVTVEIVIGHLRANTKLAKAILSDTIPMLAKERHCSCRSALANAILTDMRMAPEAARKRLAPLLGRYYPH
jgi:5'-methylthioadenosine phosphorylase